MIDTLKTLCYNITMEKFTYTLSREVEGHGPDETRQPAQVRSGANSHGTLGSVR